MPDEHPGHDSPIEDRLDTQTIALRVIATLLVVGAAYLLAGLLVPLVLALFLAIALSPVASWLERRARFPKTLAALTCALGVALLLLGFFGVAAYQAGTIIQDSDRYIERFGSLLGSVSRRTGGEQLMESLGVIRTGGLASGNEGGQADPGATGAGPSPSGSVARQAADAADEGTDSSRRGEAGAGGGPSGSGGGFYTEFLRRNLRTAGQWLVRGIGGLLGLLGGLVVLIAYLFYMLNTRDEWLERIRRSSRHLGMSVTPGKLQHLRQLMVTYIGYLAIVSLCYAVVLTIALWLIGVPQPLLWGVLTGLLEVVPYFGPVLAASLPTIVALSLGTWWQPITVLVLYVVLQTVEGYVVAPILYGSAVRINPVTIIFGLLFFGWLWGPVGLMTAMPMMILLRGFVEVAPDTPALDAFVEDEEDSGEARKKATSGKARA